MKKTFIIFLISLFSFSLNVFSQEYKQEGNVFSLVKKARTQKPDIDSGYKIKENDSLYVIYITPKEACYINKVSKKTGKKYRKYLSKNMREDVIYLYKNKKAKQ